MFQKAANYHFCCLQKNWIEILNFLIYLLSLSNSIQMLSSLNQSTVKQIRLCAFDWAKSISWGHIREKDASSFQIKAPHVHTFSLKFWHIDNAPILHVRHGKEEFSHNCSYAYIIDGIKMSEA